VHVLVVPSWYPTTEAPLDGIYFAEQARCLTRHGLQVGVVYPEQQSLRRLSWTALRRKHFQTEWACEEGVPTLRRYGWNVWSRVPPGLRCRVRSAVRLADRYVRRHGVPDLLHAQSGRWAGAAAARIGARYDVPYALTEHFSGFLRDGVFPWRWPLVREGYDEAGALAAVSPPLRRAIADHGLAAPSDVESQPNLAPPAFLGPPPSDRPSPPPFRFVTVARLSPRKNVGGLLDALAMQPGTETTLAIVGDGPERSRLEDRARDLGLTNQVRFLGRCDRGSVREALWNAHAFVLPSHHETFGVVLLEAMATGLPVLATACGGPEALVTPETGLLVPPGTPDALAEGLSTLRARWPSFDADAIRARTREQYGPAAFVRRTRALYRRALHEDRS
jgi:glycosyltransferase involved in cell wall biosynthesis